MSVGSSATFESVFTPDNANEIGIPMSVSKDGDCALWLTPDIKAFNLTTTGSKITTTIRIPSNAKMGKYECRVIYSSPPMGMIRANIAVPYYINVTNGVNGYREIETPTPTITTHAETSTATTYQSVPVTKKDTTIPITQSTIEHEQNASIGFLQGTNTLIAVCAAVLLTLFGVVMAYDARRGKRR